MMGWKEITEKVAKVYFALPKEEQAKTILYSNEYGFAGAMNFYGRKMGLPEVYSHNASFLLWMPDSFHIKNVLVAQEDLPDTTNKIDRAFKHITIEDSLNIPLARENGTKIVLFQEAGEEANKQLSERVRRLKNKYRRQ